MATVIDQYFKVLTEGTEIQQRQKEYTERLYSKPQGPARTLAETEHAIEELARNKASGIDNIHIELEKMLTRKHPTPHASCVG